MKKNFSRKLGLNKTTVANLDFEELRRIYAGGVDPYTTSEVFCCEPPPPATLFYCPSMLENCTNPYICG